MARPPALLAGGGISDEKLKINKEWPYGSGNTSDSLFFHVCSQAYLTVACRESMATCYMAIVSP